MSSAVSLPNHTSTRQDYSSMQLTSIVHILLPETDICPSWISGRETMTIENISWPNLHERMLPTRWGLNPQPPDHQLDEHSMEPQRPAFFFSKQKKFWHFMWTVCQADNSCEMSGLIFSDTEKKKFLKCHLLQILLGTLRVNTINLTVNKSIWLLDNMSITLWQDGKQCRPWWKCFFDLRMHSLHRSVSITPDKVPFAAEKYWYFSYFFMKTYIVGTH